MGGEDPRLEIFIQTMILVQTYYRIIVLFTLTVDHPAPASRVGLVSLVAAFDNYSVFYNRVSSVSTNCHSSL